MPAAHTSRLNTVKAANYPFLPDTPGEEEQYVPTMPMGQVLGDDPAALIADPAKKRNFLMHMLGLMRPPRQQAAAPAQMPPESLAPEEFALKMAGSILPPSKSKKPLAMAPDYTSSGRQGKTMPQPWAKRSLLFPTPPAKPTAPAAVTKPAVPAKPVVHANTTTPAGFGAAMAGQ